MSWSGPFNLRRTGPILFFKEKGIYPMRQPIKTVSKPYLFSADLAVAGAGTGQIIFQVNADFEYHCSSFSYRALAATVSEIPYFSLQILANDDRIMFNWVRSDIFAGMGIETSATPDIRYPVGLANWFRFDCPYIFPPRSNIVISIRNDIANAINLHFALNGKRVYTLYS